MYCVQWSTIFMTICVVHRSTSAKLEEKFSWENVEYDWPSPLVKEDAISEQKYIKENSVPVGLDVWKDKLFITVPRFLPGVASSLNYVNILTTEKSPILKPYPDWEANTVELTPDRTLVNNSVIASALRVRVDECDRLWIMDSGFFDYLGVQVKPPTLFIFDLNKDKLIRQYSIPPNYLKVDSYFANVIVDVRKNECDYAFAYMPDIKRNGVVVYSYKQNESWRAEHSFFHIDPLFTDYNIDGINFQWNIGVFGMTLGKPDRIGVRTIYFHALSSSHEFAVPNYVLQNRTRAESSESFHDYYLVGDRGPNGQSMTEFLDEKSNVMFYTQVNKDAIYCWNADKPYNLNTQGIVEMNSVSLVFVNDLKVDRYQNLWVLSDRLPLVLLKKLNPNEFTYRILRGKVNELIAGTRCKHYWSSDFFYPS